MLSIPFNRLLVAQVDVANFNSRMEETFFLFLCFQILEVQIDVLASGATCKQGRRCPFSRENLEMQLRFEIAKCLLGTMS